MRVFDSPGDNASRIGFDTALKADACAIHIGYLGSGRAWDRQQAVGCCQPWPGRRRRAETTVTVQRGKSQSDCRSKEMYPNER